MNDRYRKLIPTNPLVMPFAIRDVPVQRNMDTAYKKMPVNCLHPAKTCVES
jgi:hypothetical protein